MSRLPSLLLILGATLAFAPALRASAPCASDDDARVIRDYYAQVRPAAPPPAVARLFRMPETRVVSALPAAQTWGVRSDRRFFAEVWESIDAWGADTRVGIVLTAGGMHVWNFPSKVPQTQGSTSPIWYDMYADDGKGVHGHITPQEVDQIWALQLPTTDSEHFTRILGFYGADGNLIIGLYVSENLKDFDPAAVAGFEKTRELLQTRPRICALD